LEAGLVEFVPEEEERDWLRPRLAVLLGVGASSALAREDLFAAWTTFLERVGGGEPVVFVIDDAQHADDGLLDFLDHLLDTARSGIFVLALARPELLARRPALGGRRATVVRLDALDDAAMTTLIDGLVSGLPEAVRSALVARAEGVPLFAVETVRALIDRDAVLPFEGRYVAADGIDSALDAIGAPASLHALVAARLDALTATERIVIADASVLGLVFTVDGLTALTPEGIDVVEVLAALRRKEIVSIETDRFAADRGNYRFVQSVVRQVAYSTQSRRDRKARHVAAANYLSIVPEVGDDQATVIAQHLLDALDASSTTDPDVADLAGRASALLERAAQRTRSLGSPSEALRLTISALAHTEDPTDRARLHLLAAECAADAAQYDQAIEHAASATTGYDDLDDPVRAGVAAGVHAFSLVQLRDAAGALAIGQPRWDSLVHAPDSELALLRLARPLAAAYTSRGDKDQAEFFNKRRLFLAEAVDSPDDLTAALVNLGTAYGLAGAPKAGLVMVRGAAGIDRERSRPANLANTLSNMTSMLFSRDVRQALDTGREGLEVARRSGVRSAIDFAGLNYALALWTVGHLRDAVTVLLQTAEGATDVSIDIAGRVMWRWLGDAMGELPPLPSNFDAEPPPFEDPSDLAWFGSLALASRAPDPPRELPANAEELLQHILDAGGLGDDFVHLWPPLVSAALAAGDADLAERLTEPARVARPGVVPTLVLAHHHRFNALIGAARGVDPAEIERDFQAGLDGMLGFGAVGLAARVEEEYGRWLLTQHRQTEAALAFDHVRTVYTEIGAEGWLRVLEASQPSAVPGSVPSP
jgi:tetratricopeptide (TPR) repeat protein